MPQAGEGADRAVGPLHLGGVDIGKVEAEAEPPTVAERLVAANSADGGGGPSGVHPAPDLAVFEVGPETAGVHALDRLRCVGDRTVRRVDQERFAVEA